MRIIKGLKKNEHIISEDFARERVVEAVNNTANDELWIVKYDGNIISISGEYYKFAWKTRRDLRNALTNKFGRELANELIKEEIIEVYKVIL